MCIERKGMSEILKHTEVSVHSNIFWIVIAVPIRGGTGVSKRVEEEENSFLLHTEVIYNGIFRSPIMYFSGFQEK